MDNYLKDYNDKIIRKKKQLLTLKDSPKKTEEFVNKIVSENFEQLLYLTHNMNHDDALMNRNSSSDSDNHYLQALCLNAKPKTPIVLPLRTQSVSVIFFRKRHICASFIFCTSFNKPKS